MTKPSKRSIEGYLLTLLLLLLPVPLGLLLGILVRPELTWLVMLTPVTFPVILRSR